MVLAGAAGAWYLSAEVPDQPDLPWIAAGAGLGLGITFSIVGGVKMNSAAEALRWAAYDGAAIGEPKLEPAP